MRLYVETGDRKYLEPVPGALAYYRRSLLPDGRMARFYELRTNKPLYFTMDYRLTYDDGDMPTHYAFKVDQKLDRLEAEHERLAKLDEAGLRALRAKRESTRSRPSAGEVGKAIDALDAQGRWVDDEGLKYVKTDPPVTRSISCATFARNVLLLSRYLAPAEGR